MLWRNRYGEFWVKYPLNDSPLPVHFGQSFKAKCELATIVNRVSSHLYHKAHGKSPYTASGLVEELSAWTNSLPVCMLPRNIVFPCQLKSQ